MCMDIHDFEASLQGPEAPQLAPLLKALWWDARGDWKRAHMLAQDVAGPNGAWVHAYLHRREGDAGNAAYWYRQAGRPVCRDTFEAERRSIAMELLAGGG